MSRRGPVAAFACTALFAGLLAACSGASLPTHDEAQLRVGSALARALSQSLQTLPGVERAQVHVALPAMPAFADSIAPAPQASVLVHAAGANTHVDVTAVQELVAGAVSQLTPSAVRVVVVPPRHPRLQSPPLERVGPFRVATASAASLRALLITMLLVQAALALTLCVVIARKRRSTR